MILLAAAVVVLAVRTFRIGADWISTGLLVVALAFLLSAAHAGVRREPLLPPARAALGALALARSAASLGPGAVVAAGAVLLVGGTWQAWEGHSRVDSWVVDERSIEALVRQAAGRSVGGCRVGVIGLNVESYARFPCSCRSPVSPRTTAREPSDTSS